ncbi:MAG TPA: RNA polymerase sigma factor [Allosphingosinicella sp.]|nr:RNA polymerase sigma factor [Allosphingosinicella sp.]
MLAARAALGDVASFSELVRIHERGVRAFLRRLAGEGADDLAQETFLKAWRMAPAWRGEGSYRGWLLRIAWRQFLSDRRRRRPGPPIESEPSIPPDETIRIDVARALARLPDRERAAALLCFGEGCSHAEAAAVLGLPLGTLKSIVARARTILVRQLEGHER